MNEFEQIEYQEAVNFIMPRHYAGRIPSISWAFGWRIKGELVAVATFGKPASHSLCIGVCGIEYADRVYELNRLVRDETLDAQLSRFVAWCLRELKQHNLVIVSYADTAMNHHGYIYQATNWVYTGATKRRTDKWVEGNKHSRHYDNSKQGKWRKVRSSKHRYVYFAMSKSARKTAQKNLRYSVKPYPKGENDTYEQGFVLEPELVAVKPNA